MIARSVAIAAAGWLAGVFPSFADEAPPEEIVVSDSDRSSPRHRAMVGEPGGAGGSATGSVTDDREFDLPLFGFDLPPSLEDLIERVEESFRDHDGPVLEVSGSGASPGGNLQRASPSAQAGTDDDAQVAGVEPVVPADGSTDDPVDADEPVMPPATVPAPYMFTDESSNEMAGQADASPSAGSLPPVVAADAGADTGTGGIAHADDPRPWGPPPPDPAANQFGASPMTLLDSTIAPGTRERLHWTTGQSFSGSVMETPVVVVHGLRRGPRLCLTGGVHGDELNGIEVVRRLAYKIDPEKLSGTVIAVPIVNLLGFSRGSRYLPDRRDLNRFFPGSRYGSSASRIANSFFGTVINHCDALVDVHTGSLDRANLPQVRGDLTNPAVLEFTRGFGATAVLHSPGSIGMLRHAASVRGIAAVTFEIGGPLRLQPEEIEYGVQAIETLLNKMGMIEHRRRWREPQAIFYESRWVRVDHGGMLFSEVALGDRVKEGQRLGRVIDPVSNRAAEVVATDSGRIIGMALNQLVLPGFAAYNLGIAASEEQVVTEAAQEAAPDDERFLENDQLDDDQRQLEEADRMPGREADVGRRDGGIVERD